MAINSRKGNVSIHAENMFPIIKKWLYSDKDIFIRELVSNGCDAVSKLKRLVSMGEACVDEPYRVTITIDKEKGALIFEDNGIGMTEEEVDKYINSVAFSGAKDFFDSFKDKMDESNDIIGHFGLGFYSAFMVSDAVVIDTKSYKDEPAVRWYSEDGMNYEIGESSRENRGTSITLIISEDSREFLETYKVSEVLKKYCSFLPVEIYLESADSKAEAKDENIDADSDDDTKSDLPKAKPINNTEPLWLKRPSECTDEEYKQFYREVFNVFDEPLFWIHLNLEYPFNLKGILYFPKLNSEFELVEGKVKLYNNRVFVADNIKEVIPEFLLLLKGVIDCPDLPLNVSRSFLQNDKEVAKISKNIVKKVADKIKSLFKNEREQYEKFWDDIQVFIKFGCLKDESFYDRIKDYILFEDIYGEYITLDEYSSTKKSKDNLEDEASKDNLGNSSGAASNGRVNGDSEHGGDGDSNDNGENSMNDASDNHSESHEHGHEHRNIYYVGDKQLHNQYINMFKAHNLNALILDKPLDDHFVGFLEYKNHGIMLKRIDADIEGLISKGDEIEDEIKEKLLKLFRDNVKENRISDFKVENLKDHDISSMVSVSEESIRLSVMKKQFGSSMPGLDFEEINTLVINASNPLVKDLLAIADDEDKAKDVREICNHIADLAMLANKELSPEEMNSFIKRSNKLVRLLLKNMATIDSSKFN